MVGLNGREQAAYRMQSMALRLPPDAKKRTNGSEWVSESECPIITTNAEMPVVGAVYNKHHHFCQQL